MRTLAGALVALLLSHAVVLAEAVSTKSVASAMGTAAQQFLDTLSDADKARGNMSFDDPQRVDWTNVPKPTRKGIQVREMTAAQREKCHKLLQASLSAQGYEKACQIMSLENNLREGEKGLVNAPLRDPERYFLTIFGTPGQTGTWGYSFEGHHLSLNFVVKDGVVLGDTPSFWGANPATVSLFVENGPPVGARTLAAEEQLAFDLVNSFDDQQKAKAILTTKAPADYRNVGKPNPPSAPQEGLAAADMTDAQKAILWKLLEGYAGHLATPVAEERLQEIKQAGIDKIRFSWLGSTDAFVGHSYRVEGPTFVLELINVQSGVEGKTANHIHSVWRSLTHDFGFNTASIK